MMFRVGQKVVCVDASPMSPQYANAHREIAVGEIYVIRWIGSSPHPHALGQAAVRLSGIVRSDDIIPEWCDMPFRASRFRPIVSRKTDISIFHRILRSASHKELT